MTDTHQVPRNTEAEANVLASLLIDPGCWHKVRAILEPGMFHDARHRTIFQACESVSSDGAIDQVTVAASLKQSAKLDQAGGLGYLSRLVADIPTSVHATHYAGIVRECYQRRRLIDLAGNLAQQAYGDTSVDKAISDTLTGLLATKKQEADQSGLTPFSQIADRNIADFGEWVTGKRNLRGISTGLPDLDRAIDGLEPGKLYLVGARPAMGKTMLLIKLACSLASHSRPIALFSLEQNERAIFTRAVLAEARVDRYEARRDGAHSLIAGRLWEAYGDMAKLPVWVDDTAAITTGETASRLLALATEQKLAACMFDYIDLAGDVDKSEEQRIASIAKRLREIAKVANIPVVAACQLNRQVEARQDKRPQLADLRYSGALEQVADVVMFLYRDEYYSGRNMKTREPELDNVLEVIIAKNKDGPIGKVQLYYDVTTGVIDSLASGAQAGMEA